MGQQIARSTVTNKTRLKVLSARQELLDDIFEKARSKLSGSTKDKKSYQGTLKNLILEGLYALGEPKVQVRGRKADYAIIKGAIADAKKEYKEKTGNDISIEIDENNDLPSDL